MEGAEIEDPADAADVLAPAEAVTPPVAPVAPAIGTAAAVLCVTFALMLLSTGTEGECPREKELELERE